MITVVYGDTEDAIKPLNSLHVTNVDSQSRAGTRLTARAVHMDRGKKMISECSYWLKHEFSHLLPSLSRQVLWCLTETASADSTRSVIPEVTKRSSCIPVCSCARCSGHTAALKTFVRLWCCVASLQRLLFFYIIFTINSKFILSCVV